MTRRLAPPLAAAAAAAALTPAMVAAAGGRATAARPEGGTTGRLLVTLDAGATTRAVRAAVIRTGADTGAVVPQIDLMTVRPPAGAGAEATATALRALPGVAKVEVERRFTLRDVPNDPALSTPETAPGTPAGTTLEWWAQRQNLPALWDITRGSKATVAVIDTGIDGGHPDLGPQISASIDNDATRGAGPATTDEVGHGTNVASLACAAGDNGIGLVGAGRDCRLLIVKSDLSDSSVATSIVQAVDGGADAINMSFGTDGSQPAATPIVRAIDYAVSNGVILVAAAADEPTQEQGDPSNVLQPTGTGSDITQGKGLSITAAEFSGRRAPFAGLGSQISMAAYGSFDQRVGPPGIFGAFPGNATDLEQASLFGPGCGCRATFNGDNRYAYLQGTSMAAPMVAAVAALIKDLNPDLSAPEVIRILKQTATRPAGTGFTADLGWGILNGGLAGAAARGVDRRAPTSSVRTTARVVRGRSVQLNIRSSDKAPPGLKASGVRKVELYRVANGGKARRLLTTTKSKVRVPVRRGSRYRFWTRAVDEAGNREAAPTKSDTTVRGGIR